MSIQTELTRLTNAKAAIKTAIEGKGVTVPDGTMLDGMAALIQAIEAGGAYPLYTKTFTLADTVVSNFEIDISDCNFDVEGRKTAWIVLLEPKTVEDSFCMPSQSMWISVVFPAYVTGYSSGVYGCTQYRTASTYYTYNKVNHPIDNSYPLVVKFTDNIKGFAGATYRVIGIKML